MFLVDASGVALTGIELSDEAAEIAQILKDGNLSLGNVRNQRIRTAGGVYYISARQIQNARFEGGNGFTNEGGESIGGDGSANDDARFENIGDIYWIIYADVTGLTYFANTINLFLIFLVLITFAITVFVVIFLSNSITRPIKKLSTLALSIGRGNFTPQDYKFKDMEFENLNMTLNKTAKQLDIYDAEQKAFFQNASHELRTPLMSIKCYAEGISVGLMEPQKASETILRETDRLSEMVTDLLYISKIDNITSAYNTTRADITKIIRDCAEGQKIIADKKSLRFYLEFSEQPINCDCVEELMARAVNNLISNAIRYAVSEITLECHKRGGQVIIKVSDDGAGIDKDSMPHIFERFYKGFGGNHGIGLSIVKSIVLQHGGQINAGNAANGGAVFTIALPLRK
jgi:signal transduction histidine kinase